MSLSGSSTASSQARQAPRPRPGTNANVFGRKGSGKTHLVKRSLLAHHSRILIVDPLREYGDVAIQVQSLEQLADYLAGTAGTWRVTISNDRLEADLEAICEAAYELGDLLLVLEECSWWCSPSFIPDYLKRFVQYGRHRGVWPLAIARRPSEIHRMFTSEAYEVYCFTMQEPNDLDYLKKYVSASYAEAAQQLPPKVYLRQNLWDRTEEPQQGQAPA